MPETSAASFDTGARIVDKRKNWEARVEMAVFKRPACELSTYDKLVYAILCGHANRDGNAMLYVKTIAEEASCSERQVQRTLSNLESRRLLVRRSQNAPGRGQIFNIYEVYGFDEYTPGDYQSPHPATDSRTPVTDSHSPSDCQSGPNNVFQQPLKNSLKENNIPPTPQGVGEGKSEKTRPQNPKHDTEEKNRSRIPAPSFPEVFSHIDVLTAFNEILPDLPRAEMLTTSRTQTLNLRINEDPARQNLDWWRRFFERVRIFPWLMGNNPNNWKATFDWLIGEVGMQKVIEGSFTQEQRYQGYSREELREWQKKYTDERGIVDAKALLRDWREKTAELR